MATFKIYIMEDIFMKNIKEFNNSDNLDGFVKITNTEISLSYALENFEDEDLIVEIIQKEGVNVNIEDSETGNTALHTAIEARQTKVALALIKESAYLNAVNKTSLSPMRMALLRGNITVVRALFKAGAIVNDEVDVYRLDCHEKLKAFKFNKSKQRHLTRKCNGLGRPPKSPKRNDLKMRF